MPSEKKPLFQSYKISSRESDQQPCGLRPLKHTLIFGETLRMDAAAIQSDGAHITVLTRWTVLNSWPHDAPPKLSVRIKDETGATLAQKDDLFAVAFQHWQSGDTFLQISQLQVEDMNFLKSNLSVVVYSAQGALPASVDGGIRGEEAPVMLK